MERSTWRPAHRGEATAARSTNSRLAILLVIVSLAIGRLASAEPPPTPDLHGVPVDLYGVPPAYECLPDDPHRSGVERFLEMVLNAYPGTVAGNAWASCDTHSPSSLHHSGRAWDWVLAGDGAVASPEAIDAAYELLGWLLETMDGQPDARARRLGIVEIIWFGELWTSHTRKWDPYPIADCTDPASDNTTCHRDHVHFTFSRSGAEGDTSWWRGTEGFIRSLLETIQSTLEGLLR